MFRTLKATGAMFWLEALKAHKKRMSHDQNALVPFFFHLDEKSS